jgi:hypothetical protein
MDRYTRLPLAVLLAAGVLGLLTGVAAVAVAVRDDGRRPEPVVLGSPAVEPDATRVLRSWDERRSRAYARADVSALADLYVPGSRTGAADRGLLRAYRERGLRVTGMRTQVLDVRVVRATESRICVVVTDMLVDAVADDRHGGGWALPRDGPSTRRVVLVRDDGSWRVEETYPVG